MSVNFQLSDEQKLMQETAKDFAVNEIRPVAEHHDRDSIFPRDIINKAWELGLMNTSIPEAYGGAELDFLSGSIIEEQLSWGCSGIATSIFTNGLASTAGRARRYRRDQEEVPHAARSKSPSWPRSA